MDVIRALAQEIGPRPACSKEEQRAARWCAAHLQELDYETTLESFRSRPSYKTWYAAYLALSLIAAALVVLLPLGALLIGLAALVLYARDGDGRPLIPPRGGVSVNVVARRRGEVAPPNLIVTAHIDSARAALNFHPRMVGSTRASIVTLQIVLLAVPLLGAVAWLADANARTGVVLLVLSIMAIAYLAFAMALLIHSDFRMPHVAGANDNASGVEVALRLAAELDHHGVWFVLTGSEEEGMLGIQALIAQHEHEIGGARFLNIDNVGAGRVIAADEEGILFPRRADEQMVVAAERAGAEIRAYRLLPTDGSVLLARKYKGLSLLALDERGILPNWHWPTDVPANIDPETVDRATTVALGVARSVLEKKVLR